MIERGVADAMLPTELLGAYPDLVHLQNANDLFFAETAFPHRLSPLLENRLTSNCGLFRGAGQTKPSEQMKSLAQIAKTSTNATKNTLDSSDVRDLITALAKKWAETLCGQI